MALENRRIEPVCKYAPREKNEGKALSFNSVCLQSANRGSSTKSVREKRRRRSLFHLPLLFLSPASSLAPLLRQNYSRHRTEWPPRSLAWPENERQGKEAPFVREEDRERELEKDSSSRSFGRNRAELVPASAAAAAASVHNSSSSSSSSCKTSTENDGRGEKERKRERLENDEKSIDDDKPMPPRSPRTMRFASHPHLSSPTPPRSHLPTLSHTQDQEYGRHSR